MVNNFYTGGLLIEVHNNDVCYNMVFLPFIFFNHSSFYQRYFCLVMGTLGIPLDKDLVIVIVVNSIQILPVQKISELSAVFQAITI